MVQSKMLHVYTVEREKRGLYGLRSHLTSEAVYMQASQWLCEQWETVFVIPSSGIILRNAHVLCYCFHHLYNHTLSILHTWCLPSYHDLSPLKGIPFTLCHLTNSSLSFKTYLKLYLLCKSFHGYPRQSQKHPAWLFVHIIFVFGDKGN